MFIDTLLEGFEHDLMWDVAHQDQQLLGWPDLTIFLKISEERIKKFIAQGDRTFDKSEEFIHTQALPVNQMHSEFFTKQHAERILTIDRDALDFEKDEDLQWLVEQIKLT
ncbi:MAG: hypothetical protein AAB515_02460 [Patescibacteria group bacterium]